MDSRAAVFTSSPLSVEVHQAGTWWRGELLGWRHDASGTCQMWVRVVVGGVEETAWVDLATLRLPEAQADPTTAARPLDTRVEQELPTAQVVSALRGRPLVADAATTAALPMIRDEIATPTVSVRRPGGRRRAPEDADIQVVIAAEVAVPPGRHRALRDEGQHRAADTGVLAAVAERPPASGQPTVAVELRRAARWHAGGGWSIPQARAARPEESYDRPEVCAGRAEAEPDLLTRPMRLGDLSPSSRRPTVGGSLSGV
jgi:hypothetical protein